MRTRAALTVAALALGLLAAGCGGGGGGGGTTTSSQTTTTTESTSTTSASGKDVLVSAVSKIKDQSSKFKMNIKVESDALSTPLSIPIDGEFDYANKTGRMTMDYGQVLSAAGTSGSGKLDIIEIGTVYYMKWPLLSQSVGASTPWVSFDLTKLNSITGIDTSSLKTANQGDPSQTLTYLKAAGSVEDQGTEDVGGVETTKYHAVIDLDQAAANAPAGQKDAVQSSVDSLENTYGISELPMDVWIDKDGLPRKLDYSISAKVSGQSVKTSLVMELSDYGVDVNATAPPSSQVTDLANLGS